MLGPHLGRMAFSESTSSGLFEPHIHSGEQGHVMLHYSAYNIATSHSLTPLQLYLGGGGGLVAKLRPTLATPWTVACQVPLSMGFSRQEYWSGLLFPSPGNLPNPGIKPRSPAWAGKFFTTEPPGKPIWWVALFKFLNLLWFAT